MARATDAQKAERLNRARTLLRKHAELPEAAEHLARVEADLTQSTSLDQIDALLVDEPADALQLGSAAVFRRDDDGTFRQHVPGAGWVSSNFELLADDRLVSEVRAQFGPRRIPSSPRFFHQVTGETGQPALAIPIYRQKMLFAIALYGLHQRGDDLEQREIDCLEKLGLSASAAYEQLENERLRSMLAELEAKLAKSHTRGRVTPRPGHV